ARAGSRRDARGIRAGRRPATRWTGAPRPAPRPARAAAPPRATRCPRPCRPGTPRPPRATCPADAARRAARARRARCAPAPRPLRGQGAVALLVFLARAAGTGLVAADLAVAAHVGNVRRGAGALRDPRPAGRRRGGRLRLRLRFRRLQRGDFRVLRLQRAHQPLAPFGLLALDLRLVAHLDADAREQRGGVVLDAVEHGREQLEGLALELVAVVLLRIAAQVDALAQVVHRRQE